MRAFYIQKKKHYNIIEGYQFILKNVRQIISF